MDTFYNEFYSNKKKKKLRGKCHLWTSVKDQHHCADFYRSHVCWAKFHENPAYRSTADTTSPTVGQPDERDWQ
jgi:hypothetical protein